MRAVSIRIKPETASGGFIAPGDYVDVMLSIEWKTTVTDENGNKLPEGTALMLPDGDQMVEVTTETVLRNVKVLAIDQSLGRSADDGPADLGKTATLEVSLSDTEKLLTASKLGSIALVLRSMVVEILAAGRSRRVRGSVQLHHRRGHQPRIRCHAYHVVAVRLSRRQRARQ